MEDKISPILYISSTVLQHRQSGFINVIYTGI